MTGKDLKDIRETKGITQAEMANSLGVTQSAISQIETGVRRPSSKLFRSYCLILGIEDAILDKEYSERSSLIRKILMLPPDKISALNSLLTINPVERALDVCKSIESAHEEAGDSKLSF